MENAHIPVRGHVWLKELNKDYVEKLDALEKEYDEVLKENNNLYNYLKHRVEEIKKYNIDLDKYKEFVDNKYIDGKLFEDVTNHYRTATDDDKVRYVLQLRKYCKTLDFLGNYEKKHKVYATIAKMKTVEFRHYCKTFYYEVQKQMILNGYGYKFQGTIGAIITNRVKNFNNNEIVDTKATRKREMELRAQGIEIYDKKKAKYYRDHNLEYKAVDPRVYTYRPYGYETILTYSGLERFTKIKYYFEPVDNWAIKNRGKTKEDFIEESKGNLDYICKQDITFNTKLNICIELDETLYLKHIRNETQSSIVSTTTRRKD